MNLVSLLLYDTALWLYATAINIYSLFNKKAKQWIDGRKNLLKQIEERIKPEDKIIWVHCASVGEFEQGRTVLEMLREKYPQYKICLTFFSPSGYALRRRFAGADYIFYLPLDSKHNASEFIRITNPHLVIFVKYEFWYHYLNELHKRKIPVLLISAIFRKDQLFFRWYGTGFRTLLHWYKQIFVQDEKSFKLLQKFRISNVTLSSDTRFDRVSIIASQVTSIPAIELFKGESKIIIGGSTWQKDEELLIRYINENKNAELKFIIVPHEIDRANIHSIQQKIQTTSVVFSKVNKQTALLSNVLIVDKVGILSALYYYAHIAYIGGGFGRGIHNILEAAVFGAPVIFGPNYKKFKEATDLIRLKSGFSVNDYNGFTAIINKLMTTGELYTQSSEGCKEYVDANTGATKQIATYLSANFN